MRLTRLRANLDVTGRLARGRKTIKTRYFDSVTHNCSPTVNRNICRSVNSRLARDFIGSPLQGVTIFFYFSNSNSTLRNKRSANSTRLYRQDNRTFEGDTILQGVP